ncbi:MAG: thiamine-phosphate pyrophosphorylase [Candidatus Omnitrophica bacterium]|nr:thiamine-phosphate pyrophosphorylase [Candidatus Omnitrophota bacterium]MBU4457708.1 thiamine-phosphate pyrophosphorylase [Candidatus Omnitrophota bacterium]
MKQGIYRIIDANLNRTREGLRVCEDILRFVIVDKKLANSTKLIRHAATRALLSSKKISLRCIIKERDTKKDIMKFSDLKKGKGAEFSDLLLSNIERSKESLRVLEECCKVFDEETSKKYRSLRFRVYDIEKSIVVKLF